MKKICNPEKLPFLTMGLTGLALCAAVWFRLSGYDEKNLPIRSHPAWYLLLVLAIITLTTVYLGARCLKKQGKYRVNFPPSIPGALGCLFACIALLVTNLGDLIAHSSFLQTITALLGILCCPLMLLAAFNRLKGNRTSFLVYLGLCLHLTFRLLPQFRIWSSDPVLQDHLFQALSSVFLAFWAYHRTTFEVNLGKRSRLVFSGLAAFFCCFAAVPTAENKLFYAAMGLLTLTNLCSLVPVIHPTETHIPQEHNEQTAPTTEVTPESDPAPDQPMEDL